MNSGFQVPLFSVVSASPSVHRPRSTSHHFQPFFSQDRAWLLLPNSKNTSKFSLRVKPKTIIFFHFFRDQKLNKKEFVFFRASITKTNEKRQETRLSFRE